MRLTLTSLNKSYGATVALADVSAEFAAGEVHAVVGENGAGKSTLMKILAGDIAPDAGGISLDGQPYRPRTPLDALRAGVAMVYQELSLAPHLSVEENILLGREPARFGVIDRAAMRAAARAILHDLDRDDLPLGVRAGDLAPAAQQLTEIARALAQPSCRVLILDEPTSSLAHDDIDRLFAAIRRLKDKGVTVIYISHALEEVQRVADRYTVLRDGRSVAAGLVRDVTPDDLVRHMAGRDVGELFPRSTRQPGDVVLDVRDLAGETRPTHASFSLRRGEVLGIGGLMGAGRTELLRAIFALDPVHRGSVRVAAYAGPASPSSRVREGVGFLSEDRKMEGLALELSIADNVTLSRLDGLGPARLVLPARQRAAARPWLDRLHVRSRDPRQRVVELSGGNQQKIALARLLHQQADIFLLDEPTRGIDVGSKREIYQAIDDLARSGKAILVVSSYVPELLGICDRVAVMTRGTLGPVRPVADVDRRTILKEATA